MVWGERDPSCAECELFDRDFSDCGDCLYCLGRAEISPSDVSSDSPKTPPSNGTLDSASSSSAQLTLAEEWVDRMSASPIKFVYLGGSDSSGFGGHVLD